MDRSKFPRKPSKSHAHPGPGELFALGKGDIIRKASTGSTGSSGVGSSSTATSSSASRSSPLLTSGSSSSKSGLGGSSSLKSSSSSDKKREGSSSSHSGSSSSAAKKIRLHGSSSGSSSGTSSMAPSVPKLSSSASSSSSATTSVIKSSKSLSVKKEEEVYDTSIQDFSVEQFLNLVEKAQNNGSFGNMQPLILQAMKRLWASRDKPDPRVCMGLMRACITFPQWFQSSSVVEYVAGILNARKALSDVKTKLFLNGSPLPPFLVCLMTIAYADVQPWPAQFFQMWVEDACNDRIWVDRTQCKRFIENIQCSFNTLSPNTSLLQVSPESAGAMPGSSSPLNFLGDSDPGSFNDALALFEPDTIPVLNRAGGSLNMLETIVLDCAKDLIAKKAPDMPKNVIRALSTACGLVGVRAYSVIKLDVWIHHQKTGRQAQDLLMYLCMNADAEVDNDIVLSIVKLRFKQKPLANFGAAAIKEMVLRSDANLKSVLNYIVSNEVSSQRNPNNFQILSTCMIHVPAARKLLAEIFVEFMAKREDQHHALRSILRETVRSSRFEFELKSFVDGLTQFREINWKEPDGREKAFVCITDLIILCMFLSVSPAVRESALLKGDTKDMNNINIFHNTVADLQDTSIFWLYHVVPKMFRPSKKEFGSAINKIILRDPINDIVAKDGWPPEAERSIFARLCLDIPLRENVLMWTLLMGVSKDHPLNQPEILDIVEFCVLRSAQHKGGLELRKLELLQGLFRLCEYKHPENIALPLGYEPPNLAISKLYWKVWIILCVISAHNPLTFGKLGWEEYPTLKVLMEMCMTSHFSFPTASATETAEEIHLKEMQVSSIEKGEILEFEQHLAAASSKQVITEKNSLLLPQLIRMDPLGAPRNPPSFVLSQLMSLNEQMHLGHHFCRSRNPDFLLDLIQRNSQPMPWLSELVSEGPIDILPVQCLCELMLGQVDKIAKSLAGSDGSSRDKPSKKMKASEDSKNLQLLNHLQGCVHDSEADSTSQKEIMDYFFRRLASPKKQNREQALKGLQMLLIVGDSNTDDNWLLDRLHNLSIFDRIRGIAMQFLRQAIQVENEPEWISRYLEFLSVWSNMDQDDQLAGLAFDAAQLVVERNGVCQTLLKRHPKTYDSLFDIFVNFLKRTRGPQKESYKWSDSQEQVLVQWAKEKQEATMNILVVHAVVIVLSSYSLTTQAQNTKTTEVKKLKTGRGRYEDYRYQELLEMWFPTNGDSPKGYLMNTMEEAILFPDWIKLRMIRSNNSKLVTAALLHADIDQLLIYVQTFGIPVQSMTALLYCLDSAAQKQPGKVLSTGIDAQYMKTLVEVQWKRGASGGEVFMDILKQRIGSEDVPMDTTSGVTTPYTVRPPLPETFTKSTRTNTVFKVNLPVELKIKPDTHEAVISKMVPVPEESENDQAIRQLSKELLNTLSVNSNRRRSSAPTDDGIPGTSSMLIPRRHSMYAEKGNTQSVEQSNREGPLLDKIIEIEPCIIKNAVDLQVQLIFERNISPLRCRPFLLNALAHQSSWKTVEFCINYFLKECDTKYDPTNVLDLIAATVKNPALWHGGDKYVPKHQPEMPMIKLNREQLLVLADYIIEEISCTLIKNAKFSISNLLGPSHRPQSHNAAKPKQKLKERVRLWLVCCESDKDLVNYIIKDILTKRSNSPHAKKFLAQLYLEFPEAMIGGTWQECDDIVMNDDELSSTLDTIAFNLITAVATNEPGKDWQKKAQHCMEPALRKLASAHPVLLLRQLPLMCTLLEGRVHLDFGVFQAQNHHVPYKIFIGLWDFMQPYILKHFKTIKNALLLYLKLFENFGHIKDFSLEVRRLSVLLHNFWLKHALEVEEFMQPFHKLLTDLGAFKNYVDVSPLHNLIEVLVPPQNRRAYAVPVSGFGMMDAGAVDLENQTIMMFQDRIQHVAVADDMYPILQDLDSASNRNPSILENFSERLKSVLVCNNEMCRTLAFSLILKHMTYMPKSKNVYFDSVMSLLHTENPHVRETVIERISEFVMLSNERAEEILMRLFELGVSANVNVQPAMGKTLAIFRSCSAT